MYHEISDDMLRGFESAFAADAVNGIRMRAAVKSGLEAAAENQKEDIDHPMIFSVELKSGEITDQKSSGRCWLFAGLNALRYEIMKRLNLETFELSQNYQMFYDKLEKANYFLESVLSTLDEALDSRLIHHLLTAPVQDGGQWDMFCALVDKYGCVPKCVMPETFHSSNTGMLNTLLTKKLREDALKLRELSAAGADNLMDVKAEMLREIYAMLCIALGEPPRSFIFEYRDKDEAFHREGPYTPKEFAEKYVGDALAGTVSVINAPTKDKPYCRSYTVSFLGNVAGGRPVKYLNLPVEELKRLAIAQLKDGRPVWFGSDVGQHLQRERGVMGLHTFDYEALLGVRFSMDKAQRLDALDSLMTHAMVLLGVNLNENGQPDRWKVENSWSEKRGQKGYYVMTDEWFSEYTYQVVIDKKYLSQEQLAAYEQEPIALKPWDPMGSLAALR